MIQTTTITKIIFLCWKLHCNFPCQIHTHLNTFNKKYEKHNMLFFMCYISNIGSRYKRNEQKSICTMLHCLLLLRQIN